MVDMDFYNRKNLWKFILFIFAAFIGAATLWYTESFLEELRKEEQKKMTQFAEAMQTIQNSDDQADLNFEYTFISNNTTIPLILTDAKGNLIQGRNIKEKNLQDTAWVKLKLIEMVSEQEPLKIEFADGQLNYIYYQNSILLTKLRFYPMVLLFVISLFVIIAYVAFSNARRAEQNQVWNGLAKETAHQIGTPLSSLMGWTEWLKSKDLEHNVVAEMEKDVARLQTITERFSKIGSQPKLEEHSLKAICESAVSYLSARSPKNIKFNFSVENISEYYPLKCNKELLEWVIENLVRNAIDATEGKGFINISLTDGPKNYRLSVEDSGKGIPLNQQNAIFRPGFSTKSRGWGLGLSLAKRIVEDYHGGKLQLMKSELGSGSTFRIQLKKG